jgi:hypothetical protein
MLMGRNGPRIRSDSCCISRRGLDGNLRAGHQRHDLSLDGAKAEQQNCSVSWSGARDNRRTAGSSMVPGAEAGPEESSLNPWGWDESRGQGPRSNGRTCRSSAPRSAAILRSFAPHNAYLVLTQPHINHLSHRPCASHDMMTNEMPFKREKYIGICYRPFTCLLSAALQCQDELRK